MSIEFKKFQRYPNLGWFQKLKMRLIIVRKALTKKHYLLAEIDFKPNNEIDVQATFIGMSNRDVVNCCETISHMIVDLDRGERSAMSQINDLLNPNNN